MKKLAVSLLIASMTLSLVACGNKNDDNSTNPSNESVQTETTETVVETTQESVTETVETAETVETTETENNADTQATGETIGNTLKAQFISELEANPDLTLEELATLIVSNPVLGPDFSPVTMEVEPGLLTGFDNAEITGFSEGIMFAPMIGTRPFVGYIFTLEDGADVDAFIQTLTDNANPRWNICTEAEETVTEQSGNKVFFVMSPKSFTE